MPEKLEGRVPGRDYEREKLEEQGVITLLLGIMIFLKVIDLHSLVALVKFIEWRIDKSAYVNI